MAFTSHTRSRTSVHGRKGDGTGFPVHNTRCRIGKSPPSFVALALAELSDVEESDRLEDEQVIKDAAGTAYGGEFPTYMSQLAVLI